MYPPVIDLHCDLLSYLEEVPNAHPFATDEIGCSIPSLKAGNVGLQILAIYTATEKGSTELALNQSLIFKELLSKHGDDFSSITKPDEVEIKDTTSIGIVAAIENASGFCEEDESLDDGFKKLEEIIQNTTKVLYITMTHHMENRFGGGNYSDAGLKEDGKALLDYLDGRKIAIDFSHTSDTLADGILDHITKRGLNVPVIASHSNFREIFDHPRNLTDTIAKEIINREGLIGMNFVRAFVNNEDPNVLYDHVEHGLSLGAENSLCFGADFFHPGSHPDPSRIPFFHKEHESADRYPSIIDELSKRLTPDQVSKIAHENVIGYLKRTWS